MTAAGPHVDDALLGRIGAAELERDEIQWLESHLAECAACRELVTLVLAAGSQAETIGPFARGDLLQTTLPMDAGQLTIERSSRLLAAGDAVDHFRVIELLGRGGMGEVYLARDESLQRLVALKVVSARSGSSVEARDRVLQEARTTARFNHPHIVAIFAVGQYHELPYMALEYLPGRTLRQRLDEGPVAVGDALAIALAVSDALREAHAHDVLHLDLKPGNVMLAEDGRLRVLDFGLAESASALIAGAPATVERLRAAGADPPAAVVQKSFSVALHGTPSYMAPEQWAGSGVGPRADIWALGLMLCELFYGQGPFAGAKRLGELIALITLPSPVSLPPPPAELPESLAELIERCLRREPTRRPSADEVVVALRRLEGRTEITPAAPFSNPDAAGRGPPPNEPTSAAGGGEAAPEQIRSRRRRRRFVALGVALACGGALAAALVATRRSEEAPSGPLLRVAVLPTDRVESALRELEPLRLYLQRRLQRPVKLFVPESYGQLRAIVRDAAAHAAILPPLQYVLARAQHRATALATQLKQETNVGYLLQRVSVDAATPRARGSADGDAGLRWLRGKRMCFVARSSTTGYLLPRQLLRERGLDPDRLFGTIRFSGSHVRVLRDLANGRCDAAATYAGAYVAARATGTVRSGIRVLATTGTIPYDVVCALRTLKRSWRARLRAALLAYDPRREVGRPLSGRMYAIAGFEPVRETEFDRIEALARNEGLIGAGRSSAPIRRPAADTR